jgi:hypothetical protein
VVITALFSIAEVWNLPRCPITEEEVKENVDFICIFMANAVVNVCWLSI